MNIRTLNPMERRAIFSHLAGRGMMNGANMPMSPSLNRMIAGVPGGFRPPRFNLGGRPVVPIGGQIPQVPQQPLPMPAAPPPQAGMLAQPTPGMMPPATTPWAGMAGLGGGLPKIAIKGIKVQKTPKPSKLAKVKSPTKSSSSFPMPTSGRVRSPQFRGGALPPKPKLPPKV